MRGRAIALNPKYLFRDVRKYRLVHGYHKGE